jgi:ABC-type transporter Mla maintaining outer membrane lipid asymmetry ATPase subunit MlaF
VRRDRIGFVYQFHHLLPDFSAAENVVLPQLIRDVDPKAAQARAEALLGALGLGHRLTHRPSQLSGGMVKRAAIARAIALEPEVLFLDEPTSGLDPITARAFDQLLAFLNRDLGITVLLVTHDLDSLVGIARRIVVLGQGRVIADGSLAEITAVDDPWIQSYFSSRASLPAPHPTKTESSPHDGA